MRHVGFHGISIKYCLRTILYLAAIALMYLSTISYADTVATMPTASPGQPVKTIAKARVPTPKRKIAFRGARAKPAAKVKGKSVAPDAKDKAANEKVQAAPSGLIAAAGSGSVSLSWSRCVGAAGYNVYRGTVSGGEADTPIYTGITTPSLCDTGGLSAGQEYFYKVAAVGAKGTSGRSNEASATPALPAPSSLTAIAGPASVALSWSPSIGAASYNIYRGTAAGGEAESPIQTGVTTASYTDTGLTGGQQYFYKVAALNVSCVSTRSSEAFAVPAPEAPHVLDPSSAGFNIALEVTWIDIDAPDTVLGGSVTSATVADQQGNTYPVELTSNEITDGKIRTTQFGDIFIACNSLGEASFKMTDSQENMFRNFLASKKTQAK